MSLEIFEKILTNFIFFIWKLQRNLEIIFDEVIINFEKNVKVILWEVSKSFDKILRKVLENFQPFYKILKFLGKF